MNKITINNYDRILGCIENEEHHSRVKGIDIENKHYIVTMAVLIMKGAKRQDGVLVPERAYELVSYDEKTKVAVAEEVEDSSLVEKIAVEMHKERILKHALPEALKRFKEKNNGK